MLLGQTADYTQLLKTTFLKRATSMESNVHDEKKSLAGMMRVIGHATIVSVLTFSASFFCDQLMCHYLFPSLLL